jgi:hypothetical protein
VTAVVRKSLQLALAYAAVFTDCLGVGANAVEFVRTNLTICGYLMKNSNREQALKLALSIDEVVVVSGLGRTLIFAEIKTGRLTARKCGRRTVILHEEVERWLGSLPTSVPPVLNAKSCSI